MIVADEVKTIVLSLQGEVLAHCAEEVADVEKAARLYA